MLDWGYELGVAQVTTQTIIANLAKAVEAQDPGVRTAYLGVAKRFAAQLDEQVGTMAAADAGDKKPASEKPQEQAKKKPAGKKPRKKAEAGEDA